MMVTPSEIRIGRYATNGYEPRQVREEAAVNNAVCVVTDSNLWFLGRGPHGCWFERGCTAKSIVNILAFLAIF